MTSTLSSTPSDRSELLFLGKECHHPACYLNDFLPFSCPACHKSFCQPHFLPSHHSCTSPLPASMRDRIAPQCPVCNEVVPTPPGGGDPNEAVERHIVSGSCVGMEGGELRRKAELKRRKEKGEICWRRGCHKVLVVKMDCDKCSHSFCPSHRHTKDHSCGTSSSSSSPSRTPTPNPANLTSSQPLASSSKISSIQQEQRTKSPFAKFLPPSMQPPITTSASAGGSSSKSMAGMISHTSQSQTLSSTGNGGGGVSEVMEAKAAAAAAAMRRAGQDVKMPFIKSKTDRRADAEVQSALKAMKARHDKGLLSKQEEVRYAELLAQNHSTLGRLKSGTATGRGKGRGNDDDDDNRSGCIVG